jgi:predicted nucleic acid-binding protein
MRIVVDTNIAFSAILNTNSRIARIILHPKTKFNFYSTEQLLTEIQEHKDKIQKLSSYSDYELDRMIGLISNRIRFINVKLIPKPNYKKAELLVQNIDEDDCEFVALTNHINGKLWTGDKQLIQGLLKKDWSHFINTGELYEILIKK